MDGKHGDETWRERERKKRIEKHWKGDRWSMRNTTVALQVLRIRKKRERERKGLSILNLNTALFPPFVEYISTNFEDRNTKKYTGAISKRIEITTRKRWERFKNTFIRFYPLFILFYFILVVPFFLPSLFSPALHNKRALDNWNNPNNLVTYGANSFSRSFRAPVHRSWWPMNRVLSREN